MDAPAQSQPMPTVASAELAISAINSLRSELDIQLKYVDVRIGSIEKAVTIAHDDFVRVPTLLDRAIVDIKNLFEQKMLNSESSLAGKIDKHYSETLERFSSYDKQTDIKFDNVANQFAEQRYRTEQLSLADKTAIAAALQAQKEAAGATNESNAIALLKMENNFTKLIEQGQAMLSNVVRNTDEKITDIKGRLDRGEGKTSVSDPHTASALRDIKDLLRSRDEHSGGASARSSQAALITGAVAMVGSIIVVVVSVLTFAWGGSGRSNNVQQSALSEQRRGDTNDLMLGRLLEQNSNMIQKLEQRLQTVPK